jgi:hypothetical protein
MGVLSQRVYDKLKTNRWNPVRDLLLQVSEILLGVSPDARGDLAGLYVKFSTGPDPTSSVYAVVWPRFGLVQHLVIGFALPDGFDAKGLGPVPKRIVYRGLTKFLVIKQGQAIPRELPQWAKQAYHHRLLSKQQDG